MSLTNIIAIALSSVAMLISAWTIIYSICTIRICKRTNARCEAINAESKRINDAYMTEWKTEQAGNLYSHPPMGAWTKADIR